LAKHAQNVDRDFGSRDNQAPEKGKTMSTERKATLTVDGKTCRFSDHDRNAWQ
jgi:hypothetical protein